jgi:hypothetical protein
MKLFLAAAAWALILTACSQAAPEETSCVERANKNFNKCLASRGDQCTPKRLHEVAICDASHATGLHGTREAAPSASERQMSPRGDAS